MHYTKDTNIIEVVVDIATLRSKIEKLQDNIDAVEKESEYLKKLNNDMNIKNLCKSIEYQKKFIVIMYNMQKGF